MTTRPQPHDYLDDRPNTPSPAELEIAAMAAELLGVPTVGVEDNLLDLGGASLELGQLIVRMRQRYGVDVRLAPFFRTPTVAYLASLVERPQQGPHDH